MGSSPKYHQLRRVVRRSESEISGDAIYTSDLFKVQRVTKESEMENYIHKLLFTSGAVVFRLKTGFRPSGRSGLSCSVCKGFGGRRTGPVASG